MTWNQQVQFVAAVPMPPAEADEFGTTVNGMWAEPERFAANDVARAHQLGKRILFSVPLVALTPRVYEAAGTAALLEEVCRDVDGAPAECDWYYWEAKPVYSACIYSEPFRRYLLNRCRDGIDRGMDVVNLDEIMTSVGLMNRAAKGSGFCPRCLGRFRAHMSDEDHEIATADDAALRAALKADDRLYEHYRRFHEQEAYRVVLGFIDSLRSHATTTDPAFVISANVAYLGNLVPTHGALWGCLWGPHIDFVLMENDYRVEHGSRHLLLPRGKFAAWYRLGSSFKGAPTWICPSITVPRQLAGQRRTTYYMLMFLEAFANRGRWAYYWWPGVDADTRLAATAPEQLKSYIGFISDHRELYEDAVAQNEIAVLYADGPISQRPETHVKYLALTQALIERGYQFDVLYVGDGCFNADELGAGELARYRVILLPEARGLGAAPSAALLAFARSGGEIVAWSESSLEAESVRGVDGDVLVDFWMRYRDEDRNRIIANAGLPSAARIESSDSAVGVTRYVLGERHVLHLLNYRYDEATDAVTSVRDLRLGIPWGADGAVCELLTPGREQLLEGRIDEGALVVEVPRLDTYALLVAAPANARTRGEPDR